MDRLRVRLLGGLEVEEVDLSQLRSRKARTLLKMLALADGRPLSAEGLVEAIWPDGSPDRPADQLSVLASRVRRYVGADRLVRADAGYLLDVDWLDVAALAQFATEARRCLRDGRPSPARAAAVAALDLARGPLLPDEPDAPWAEPDRQGAERALGEARVVAAEAMLALGEVWDAVDVAQQALAANGYDEAALRVLMRAQSAAGRPALALAAYADTAAMLAEELGTDPSSETEAVHLAVLRGQEAGERSPLPSTPEVSALPGRDAELSMLDAALATATRGRLAFVVIEGEPGIGKTALLDAWTARARLAGATVLRGAGHEFGGGFPMDAVLTAVQEHLRTLDADASGAALGDEAKVLGPLLAGVPATPAAGDLSRALLGDPDSGRALLFSALDAVVARLGSAGPVALLVDDAHLADQASAAWLHHCAARLPHDRILLVVARRVGEGPSYKGTATVPLGPLDVGAAGAVVGADLAETLHARSGGNPLFLLELSRAEGTQIPASVRELVADRCDRAGAAGASLRAAAVLGTEIDLDLLAQVLPMSATQLLDHLEEGVRRHLVTEGAGGFAFPHGLVREALVATTSPARRTHLHRRAARVLARRSSGDPMRVAHHARAGEDHALAATALADAAAVALDRFDHQEAVRLLDEAVRLDDSGALRVRRARALIAAGRHADAAADAGAGAAAGEGAEALEVAAEAAYNLREFDRALRLAEDGVRLATRVETGAACSALAGRVEIAVGNLPDAEQRLTTAQRAATGTVRPVADLWLARLHNQRGDGAAALRLLADEHVLRLARQPYAEVHLHLQAGHALALVGRPAEALAEFDRFHEAALRQGTSRFAGRRHNFRAWVLRNLGAPTEADACNERGLADAREERLGEPETHALLDLADSRFRSGDLDGASALLATARQVWDAAPALHWRHEMRHQLIAGGVALAADDAEAALADALSVADESHRLGTVRYGVLAELLAARARRRLGEPVPPHELARPIDALERVAPLEAWALTAVLAREFGVDAWGRLAGKRAAHLAAEAGPWADDLRREAGRKLDGLPG